MVPGRLIQSIIPVVFLLLFFLTTCNSSLVSFHFLFYVAVVYLLFISFFLCQYRWLDRRLRRPFFVAAPAINRSAEESQTEKKNNEIK